MLLSSVAKCRARAPCTQSSAPLPVELWPLRSSSSCRRPASSSCQLSSRASSMRRRGSAPTFRLIQGHAVRCECLRVRNLWVRVSARRLDGRTGHERCCVSRIMLVMGTRCPETCTVGAPLARGRRAKRNAGSNDSTSSGEPPGAQRRDANPAWPASLEAALPTKFSGLGDRPETAQNRPLRRRPLLLRPSAWEGQPAATLACWGEESAETDALNSGI